MSRKQTHNRLTPATINAAQPRGTRYYLSDGGGLVVEIMPSGAKMFRLRFRVDGASRTLAIGAYPTISLATARAAAQQHMISIVSGRDPSAERRERRAAAREKADNAVEAVVERWLSQHLRPKAKPKYYASTKGYFAAEILPRWGSRQIASITRADVRRLLADIMARPSPITANRVLSALSSLFGWAKAEEIVAERPTDGVKKPAVERSRDRVLGDIELATFWRACDALAWPFGRLSQLLLLTGCRRGEIAEARWSEIDLRAMELRIPPARSKNHRGHIVPLSPMAVEILQSLPRIEGKAGFVFTVSGASSVSGFSKAKLQIDRLMKKQLGADFQPWKLHDVRRTFASKLAELGVAPHVIEAALNHRSGVVSGVAAVYNRFEYLPERRAALELLARHIERIIDGPLTGAEIVELAGRSTKA